MNLFVVTSPFQYMCANEARTHFECQNNILLLVNQSLASALKIQNRIVDPNQWDHVITIDRKSRTTTMPKVIKKIEKLLDGERVGTFFYAEYTSWVSKLLIRNLKIEKEIYFDDGTLTLMEFEQLIKFKAEYYRPRFFQDFILSIQGCKPIGRLPQSKSFQLFTIFDIDTSDFICQTNSLTELKINYGNPKLFNPNAPIGYIGQGAIGDKNQPSVKSYINEITTLAKKLNRKIIYFPHRTERECIKTQLKNNESIIYHQSELPLELELIDKNIQLSSLIGNFSTAMFTCHHIYPDMPLYTTNDSHPDPVFQKVLHDQMKKIGVHNFYDLF